MACCKVPVKINGFSGGCGQVPGPLANIATASKFGKHDLSYMAFLGLKCVNIACPPTMFLEDKLDALAAFLDAQMTTTIDTNVSLAVLANAVSGPPLIRNGIARLIVGCGTCCSA